MKHSTRNLPARDPARFHTGVMPAPHTFHVTLTEWAHTKALPLRSDAYRDRRRHGVSWCLSKSGHASLLLLNGSRVPASETTRAF